MLPMSMMPLSAEIVTFTGALIFAWMSSDRDCWMTIVGLQVPFGVAGHSPPFENDTASPGAIRPRSTAFAPALLAAATFSLMLQAPRSTSATLPFGSDSSLSPSVVTQPRPINATSPVTAVVIGAQSTVAVLPYVPAMFDGLLTTSGIAVALGTCVCATVMTSGDSPGESIT